MLQFTPNSNIINEPSKLFMSLSAFQNCIKLSCDLVEQHNHNNHLLTNKNIYIYIYSKPRK